MKYPVSVKSIILLTKISKLIPATCVRNDFNESNTVVTSATYQVKNTKLNPS